MWFSGLVVPQVLELVECSETQMIERWDREMRLQNRTKAAGQRLLPDEKGMDRSSPLEELDSLGKIVLY
jgi:hypothetical protein